MKVIHFYSVRKAYFVSPAQGSTLLDIHQCQADLLHLGWAPLAGRTSCVHARQGCFEYHWHALKADKVALLLAAEELADMKEELRAADADLWSISYQYQDYKVRPEYAAHMS